MADESRLIRLAVFGKPVGRSLSPGIHRRFAVQAGLDVDYRAVEADATTFPVLVAQLANGGGRGCNITVPLKHEAWALATGRSARAERAQAVNTLFFRGREDWFGDNTDGGGLVRDLERVFKTSLAGARICLLGAGGAGAGVLGALLEQRPATLTVANRTRERARKLAARHADLGRVDTCTPGEVAEGEPFDLVVNATSLGHTGNAAPVAASWLRPGGLCYDMNYGMAAAPLQAACHAASIRYSDGLGMLVEQAALSFRLWTGYEAETATVLAELRKATA
jgi:shikimate dehydrogenase